jgi:alanine racemase
MTSADHLTHRPTEAVIDLDALAFNFHSSKKFIGEAVKYMAVVKADGYGHGAVRCARRLQEEGIDWFGVAIPEEGVELRRAGITVPILCMGSFWPGQEGLIVENDLTPVIFDLKTAASLSTCAAGGGRTIDIHVKIDTGMHRVGIPLDDAAAFASGIKNYSNLRVNGLMTHFASAEEHSEDPFTDLQMERFREACSAFRSVGHHPLWLDMANSPGAIMHPESRSGMVRLGGALYGLINDIVDGGEPQPELRPVLSLRSQIVYLRHLPAGEGLGYDRTFFTKRDSVIALLPIGYADGYPRGVSNSAKAMLRGVRVPVVGRISMDWTMLDVTGVPDVAIGDEVYLIGPDENGIRAAELARELGTIGYEVTCGISPRVPKVYLG